jgi:hypothetical protein
MADQGDYLNQMIQALAVAEPELDTSIGSPTRKILDVVAEAAASGDVDKHLLDYQWDINAKSGDDLDDFVLTFGFSRFAAKRSTGVVTFSRPSAATEAYPIPAGTQVTTAAAPQAVFQTTAPASLLVGQSSVEVPVAATVGGEAGNVAAGTISALAVTVNGISKVNNAAPTSGGTNPESDADLIQRFKRTVFRSMAGTEDMFLGSALEDTTPDNPTDEVASDAIVIGSSRRWREQIQVGTDGTATSSIPVANVKYVFPNSSVFGSDIDAGSILTLGVHYTFDTTVTPPRVVGIGGALDAGAIYDLDFEYSPYASRNDPVNGITNRVDVWVTGSAAVPATETTYLRVARAFNSLNTHPLFTGNFVRQNTNNVRPVAGNYFLALAFGPIISFPSSLVIGTTTYVKGTDYWVVHDDTAFGYGPTSMFGLEFKASTAPVDGTAIGLSGGNAYTYNRIPRDVEDRIRRWSLVTTDARAHAAKQALLRLNLAVMFDPNYDRATVTAALTTSLAQWMSDRNFGGAVQVSDLIQAAHAVEGIDNVRFLTGSEPYGSAGSYAIERVGSDGTRISFVTTGTPARASDVVLTDNEVAVLHSINVVPKAQNSWGSI